MRVIAGRFRSRTLAAPAGLATRPTSDRLRETLFNVLAPRIEGARFLDLYAGSGAVGIEALSRGAEQVVFVEKAPAALKVLRANLERLEIRDGFSVQAMAVGTFLKRELRIPPRSPNARDWGHPRPAGSGAGGFDVVFLDPPYEAEGEYAATLGILGHAAGLLARGAVVIAEHRRKFRLDEEYGSLKRTRLLEQGDAALSFYEAASSC